jgi:hypothetical protein
MKYKNLLKRKFEHIIKRTKKAPAAAQDIKIYKKITAGSLQRFIFI